MGLGLGLGFWVRVGVRVRVGVWGYLRGDVQQVSSVLRTEAISVHGQGGGAGQRQGQGYSQHFI